MEFFSRYNPPRIEGITFNLPSMTQQHFKEECDINNILSKYAETGIIENMGPGVYADLTQASDYRDALHTIMEADQAFQLLPSHVRKEFQNDPAQFMDFIHDPNNREKGIELGLFNEETTTSYVQKKRQEELEREQFNQSKKSNKNNAPTPPAES